MLRKFITLGLILLTACSTETLPASTTIPLAESLRPATPSPLPPEAPLPTATKIPSVPNFEHIVIIVMENREFDTVIGSFNSPYFNMLALSNTLLTRHYAITHPSLPNYLAMTGGSTFDITENCEECFINSISLPDQIEASGRSWKTYQEDMPEPCFTGNTTVYVQKHNPFIYFDPIRLDAERCARSIVPLTELEADLAASSIPNFIFITPNLCYSAHSCSMEMSDAWLNLLLDQLVPAFEARGEPYLIIITWDEGQGNAVCCGLPEPGGGRIATILISPQAKQNMQDDTPYTHYSLLKTIEAAWGLAYLGHAADETTTLITRPWK